MGFYFILLISSFCFIFIYIFIYFHRIIDPNEMRTLVGFMHKIPVTDTSYLLFILLNLNYIHKKRTCLYYLKLKIFLKVLMIV